MPSAPSYGTPGYREGDRIIDLIMAQGGIQAERAQRSGDIWSNAIGNIAEQFQGALGQIVESKKAAAMVKRDAAWVSFVESGEWQKDPKAGLTTALRIWGPQEGPKQFAGLEAVQKIGAGKPEDDAKHLGQVIGAVDPLGDDAKARWWPQLRALGAHVFPDVKIPEQYDPQMWPEITALGKQLRGEKPKELLKGNPGDVFLDPDTHQPVASIPSTPKEPKEYEVTVPGPNGQPVKKIVSREALAAGVRTYVEPKAPRDDKLVQVETVGPDGKPVTQFVEPRPGASYPKPTGAGKPATGQQRKALGYFNRAKEAQEITSTLEEGEEINPTALKYVPDIANVVLSNPNQAYRQAQRAFTEARLRKDSGAAIKDTEYAHDAQIYFAQPGDSKETKAQKRAARNTVLAGIAFEAGDALKEFYGDEADAMLGDLKKASDTSSLRPQTAHGAPRRVTRAEFEKLAPGTWFIAPDGSIRVKQ